MARNAGTQGYLSSGALSSKKKLEDREDILLNNFYSISVKFMIMYTGGGHPVGLIQYATKRESQLSSITPPTPLQLVPLVPTVLL